MHFLRRLNLCDRLAPKYHKFTQYFGLVQNSQWFVTWVHRFIIARRRKRNGKRLSKRRGCSSFTPEKVADCLIFIVISHFPCFQDRTLTHLPQKFDALRHVPGYKDFMTERFKRHQGKAVPWVFTG